MIPVVGALSAVHLVVDAVEKRRKVQERRAEHLLCLPVVLLRNFPAFNLRQSEIGNGDLERELWHPDSEASKALIVVVLDEDACV